MDFVEYDENSCRICLNSSVVINWNEKIFELCGTTYKDCYFKYTQLEEADPDPFSTMLCVKCSVSLKEFHNFVKKALESYRILRQSYAAEFLIVGELTDGTTTKQETLDFKDNSSIKQESKDFEVCLVSHSNESLYNNENHDNATSNFENLEADSAIKSETLVLEPSFDQCKQEKEMVDIQIEYKHQNAVRECTELKLEKSLKCKPSKRKVKQNKGKEPAEVGSIKRLKSASKQKAAPEEESNEESNRSKSQSPLPEGRKKLGKKGVPIMCSYCSLILADVYNLRIHEATHGKNRERREICAKCGLRFYTKMSLRSHMLTHKENREKTFKCEFCEKAYFNRGGLNVHRRIHLGLGVKCSICAKEFCRQIDLDIHLKTHSTTPPHSVKKTPTYLVLCKDCNKQIPSKSFKAHQAAHKNEPFVKCTICNRDFFCRKNCTKHLMRTHKKTKEEYDMYMHYYVEKTEMRTSHLMLEQTFEITSKPRK